MARHYRCSCFYAFWAGAYERYRYGAYVSAISDNGDSRRRAYNEGLEFWDLLVDVVTDR